MGVPLEWNVYIGNFNSGRIELHNVFEHGSLLIELGKDARKYKDNKEAFIDRLKTEMMYYYWSKCEWEVVVSHWPPSKFSDRFRDKKIDVFDQVNANWDKFAEYVWENRKELSKIKDDRKRFRNTASPKTPSEDDKSCEEHVDNAEQDLQEP